MADALEACAESKLKVKRAPRALTHHLGRARDAARDRDAPIDARIHVRLLRGDRRAGRLRIFHFSFKMALFDFIKSYET